MKAYKPLILALLALLTAPASAQYSQLGKKNEFMMKVEAGYAPFMGNIGEAGEFGYYLDKTHHGADFNIMAGVNISQDWFLGGGAGVGYYFSNREGSESMLGANVFIDFDFRPVWKAVMGLDYQPTSIKWAPEVGARVGGSMLLGNEYRYGSTITPLIEVYGGINWYYWYHLHGMRNMGRNWHSFYATLGVAYLQQTVFLPIRIGWRW